MNLIGIELTVRERLGLDPGSLGTAVLPRAVERRLQARGVTSPESYLGLLAADPAEAEALFAELVVGETWFFRGGRPLFDRLAEFVAARAADRPPGVPVRVLSVPCSTGEEPYSLAVDLHERMLPPEQYQIDAVDVSSRHLDRAAAGRYQAFAFREAGADIRPAYFRQHEERWELQPYLRQRVRLRAGNLTAPGFLADEPPYDLILCRNLFIYLTPEARRQAMETLDRLLAIDGRMCLAPGEADRLPPGRFVVEQPSEFGIYRRAGVGSATHTVLQVPKAGKPAPQVALDTPPPIRWQPTPPPRQKQPAGDALDTARELADSGRLQEALAMCVRLLRAGVTTADAYTLLGVIHQAEGHADEAAEAFRRALYLASDHPEALAHMIVICDRRGEATQAAALRRRLARLPAQETP